MKIKSISTITFGRGVFESEHALVETLSGEEFIYTLEFNEWKDKDDYYDNVASDFKNESNCKDFGEDEMGLFVKKEMWL